MARKICKQCKKPLTREKIFYRATFCAKCSHKRYIERETKMMARFHPLRKKALAIVAYAKKTGQIASLAGNKRIRCKDCNAIAEVWDHRDYAKPLEVEPVCYSCNSKRGSAKNAWI